jgi:hypothetical protein
MLTIPDIYDILQEEKDLVDFFSEDTYNGRAALTHDYADLLVAIFLHEEDSVHLVMYEYETDEEYVFSVSEDEDELADMNAKIVSSVIWWLNQHKECIAPETYKSIHTLFKSLEDDGAYFDDFEPDLLD